MTFLVLLMFLSFASAEPVPSERAFIGWTDNSDRDAVRVESLSSVEVACADQTLYPAYPQSHLKTYHEVKYGNYDHGKMTKVDEACATSGFDPKRRCLRAKILHSYILSDVFNDACGNFYRGIWQTVFFNTDESMGSLISKGRTQYEDHDSEFSGSYIDGGTYAVPSEVFLKIAPVFAGDVSKVLEFRRAALQSGFTIKSHIFIPGR